MASSHGAYLTSPWGLARRYGLPAWASPALLPLWLIFLALAPVGWLFVVIDNARRHLVGWGLQWLARSRTLRRIWAFANDYVLIDLRGRTIDPPELIDRVPFVRRLLLGVLTLHWSAVLTLGTLSGLACLARLPQPLQYLIALCLAAVLLLTFPAAALASYDRRLVKMWADRHAPLCEMCGYDRRGTPERCPECGNWRTIAPGRIPGKWERLPGSDSAYLPVVLLGTLGPLSGFAGAYVSPTLIGVFLLGLSLSFAFLVGAAAIRIVQACRSGL